MGYTKTTWVNGGTPAINEGNLDNLETGVQQNNLFEMLLQAGRYKVTTFDDPALGSITETIKLTVDDSTYATLITEFDTPTADDITSTLTCADLGISVKVVTVFNIDGSITETSEVIV